MAGVGKRERVCAVGRLLARKDPRKLVVACSLGGNAQPFGQRVIEDQEFGRGRLRRLGGRVKPVHRIVETIIERKIHTAAPGFALCLSSPRRLQDFEQVIIPLFAQHPVVSTGDGAVRAIVQIGRA